MRKSGFTLIEVLVVVGIIAVVAAIVFPVVASAKESGRSAVCVSNMRQLAMATLLYTDSNGAPPRAGTLRNWQDEVGLGKDSPFIRGERIGILLCPDHTHHGSYDYSTGYALNGCYTSARSVAEPTNSVLVSEMADTLFETPDSIVGAEERAYAEIPDNFYARPEFHRSGPDRFLGPAGQWGALRHRGKGHYAMIDGHLATLAPGEFRIPVRDRLCRLNAVNWEGPEGGPKFALQEFDVRRR